MRNNFKLVLITIIFVFTGLLLSFFALQESEFNFLDQCIVDDVRYSVGDEVVDYQRGSKCVCSKGGIIECLPIEEEILQEDSSFVTDDLETKGLDFEYSYLTGITEDQEALILSPVTFQSVSINDEKLTVVLELMQICPEQNEAPEQVGFYENVDNTVKLYNMVRPSSGEENISCMVQVKYIFEEISDLDLDDMQVIFVDDTGLSTQATICIYNDRVYSNMDVFRNLDDLICTCDEGEINCEEDLLD